MPLTKQQRREPEGHDHPTDRVESIDFSAAMGSAEGAMAAKPSGSAKQARATDEQRREPEARDHRNYRVESIDFSVAMEKRRRRHGGEAVREREAIPCH